MERLSWLIIQGMVDSRCSRLCALFVPWFVTQLLPAFSTFSFTPPSWDLCSSFYPWRPRKVIVFSFFKFTIFFCFWLIADMPFMLYPLPLAMTLTNWKLLIKGRWLPPWVLWLLWPWHSDDLIWAVTRVIFPFSEVLVHMCPVLLT